MIDAETILYDPFAPTFQRDLYQIYEVLRAEHPVYRHPERGYYALSRFDDVWHAVHEPDVFSSEVDVGLSLLPMMIFTDPPRHDRLRAIVSRAFTPRRIAQLEGFATDVARRLFRAITDHGGGDLMAELAGPLPSTVIGELIGIPRDQQPEFRRWAAELVEADPTTGTLPESAADIYQCFATLLDERRRQPADDLMSALIRADVDGARLTQDELLGFCFLLLVAGNDTTTNLIGNGAFLLATHPDQRAQLRATPDLLDGAIEEMLRYESPAQALPRKILRPVRVHGIDLEPDERVMLIWGSANRDEHEFTDPARFDIHRRIDRHLAFGHGLHYCLGASLARLEAKAAFRTLLDEAPEYTLIEPTPPRVRSGWARAFARLPVSTLEGG